MFGQTVRLLGPVVVGWEEGEPPRFRSQRTMALLGYLTTERRPVGRDLLAARFWPGAARSRGKANLRRELHNLGNILPGCWETDRRVVRFRPPAETRVDVYELLRLEGAGQWLEAAALVQGEFLEGVSLADNLELETWLMGERERWRQRAERVLRRAVEEQMNAGDNAAAQAVARRLLKLIPWHEEMHRTMMLLLARQGLRSAALKQFERCRDVLRDELGVDVADETRALYERIRDPAPFALHNIPAPTTPFIGREKELAELAEWLAEPDVRLVTITGAGGMGKTRLALALAADLLQGPPGRFADGVYLVSLAAVARPSRIVSAISEQLSFPLQSRDPRPLRQQLLDYLERKRLLLILDSFEHLLEGAALVADVLEAAEGVRIVVTSRERLWVRGEQVLPLHGLGYEEEQAAGQMGMDAARLFLDAAQRAAPAFTLREGEERELARLCARVEGMPLALELAAAWAGTLSVTDICAAIERSVSFLAAEWVDLPARHRSMRAVFDTAWNRLPAEAQQLFAIVSIFRGGFTREAAEAVAAATPAALRQLVARSLLRYDQEGERYHIHELLRQYALSRLSDEQAMMVSDQHLAYFTAYAERLEREGRSGSQVAALRRLRREFGNMEAALDWAASERSATSGLRLVVALEPYWLEQGYAAEGAARIRRLLAQAAPEAAPALRAAALRVAARLDFNAHGRVSDALRLCSESVRLARQSGDDELEIRGLCLLGQLEKYRKNFEGAAARYAEAHARAAESGHLRGMWVSSGGLGRLRLEQGNIAEARRYYEQRLLLARQLEHPEVLGQSLLGLGLVLVEEEALVEAGMVMEEALAVFTECGHRGGRGQVLRWLGGLAQCERRYEDALDFYRQSLAIAEELGARPVVVAHRWACLCGAHLALEQAEPALAYMRNLLLEGRRTDNPETVSGDLRRTGNAAAVLGRPLEAARFWGAAEKVRERIGVTLTPASRALFARHQRAARQQVSAARFAAAWAEGEQLEVEQALALARVFVMRESGPRSPQR
ncbi:MAG: BTAD domain-containing putative transcriptional regulator [Candidatus Promineifilaceae bacterium]|nr:BTAD domain-containing putative transcriptional regulator [Candidatus Promineifilaceae bacterium]